MYLEFSNILGNDSYRPSFVLDIILLYKPEVMDPDISNVLGNDSYKP